jgi:hypothetical protein
MKRSVCAAIVASIVSMASASPCLSHGTVGDYTFIEPLVAEDANPKNEFKMLRPGWVRGAEGREFGLGFSLEKTIVPAPDWMSDGVPTGGGIVSVELAGSWNYSSPSEGPPASGFGALEIMPKWAFLTLPEREMRLSVALEMDIPVGNAAVEEQHHTQMGPVFLWAKGFGRDFPETGLLKYLRPLAIQGDFGFVPALGGATWHEMFADNVIEYSLPYLSNNVKDIGLPWPIRNMYPFVEFNYNQLTRGPSGETFPQINITPGVAFMNYYLEIAVGTQLALNQATVPNDHASVLGLVDLFIDDIIPATRWTPFD